MGDTDGFVGFRGPGRRRGPGARWLLWWRATGQDCDQLKRYWPNASANTWRSPWSTSVGNATEATVLHPSMGTNAAKTLVSTSLVYPPGELRYGMTTTTRVPGARTPPLPVQSLKPSV